MLVMHMVATLLWIANCLKHLLDKLVDFLSTGTGFSTFHEMQQLGLAAESSLRVLELEWPQKVVGLLEVRTDSRQLMHQISSASNSESSETFLNDRVISNRNALSVELSESTLVHQLLDSLTCRITVGNIWFNQTQHANGSFVQTHKSGIVKLQQTKETHDLLGLWRDSNATTNAHHQTELWFGRDVESSIDLGLAAIVNGSLLFGSIFSSILLGVSSP
mmetsp:Transcript_31847/g.52500  ORF Transcript_31847/g.52500 Transcript_31847/m.52500 type:complete len:219 (-) Transcript_31847:141-797(-)